MSRIRTAGMQMMERGSVDRPTISSPAAEAPTLRSVIPAHRSVPGAGRSTAALFHVKRSGGGSDAGALADRFRVDAQLWNVTETYPRRALPKGRDAVRGDRMQDAWVRQLNARRRSEMPNREGKG